MMRWLPRQSAVLDSDVIKNDNTHRLVVVLNFFEQLKRKVGN